jgi:hypothetical protein
MPFGSKHAPRVFTKTPGYAIRFIRSHWDIRVVQYMDDLLLMHQDRAKLELYTLQIAAFLQSLGWTLSLKKCQFTPSLTAEFLGWLWSSQSLTLQMTPKMRSAMLQLLRQWLGHALRNDKVNCKALGSFIGSLNFLRAQVPRASLYLRSLHSALSTAVSLVGWTEYSSLSPRVLSELRFWSRSVQYNTLHCFEQGRSRGCMNTDACDDGWASHLVIGNQQWHTSG